MFDEDSHNMCDEGADLLPNLYYPQVKLLVEGQLPYEDLEPPTPKVDCILLAVSPHLGHLRGSSAFPIGRSSSNLYAHFLHIYSYIGILYYHLNLRLLILSTLKDNFKFHFSLYYISRY